MEKSEEKERKLFQIVRLNKKRLRQWDTIRDAPTYRLCLIGIASSDCKTDHAICVVGQWIFDANFEKALPLCRDSLDICASSAARDTYYVGTTRGVLLKNR